MGLYIYRNQGGGEGDKILPNVLGGYASERIADNLETFGNTPFIEHWK